MKQSRLAKERFRVNRREAVRQYAGPHWSEEGTPEDVPVNFLAQFITIVTRNIISQNPRALISTFNRKAKPIVSAMKATANKEIVRMCLAETLKRCAVDSFFTLGICKVALATPSDAASVAWRQQAGKCFATPVDFDDFVCDESARSPEEYSFVGHRYRAPLDTIKDSKIYSKARKSLQPSVQEPYNIEGDERIHMLGKTYQGPQVEFEEMVDLWEIYLPRYKLVLTLSDDFGSPSENDEPLRIQKWIGPDCGPYHYLGHMLVPGNSMPKAPIQDLVTLHLAANRTYRKVIQAVDRLKEITGVAGGALEDGTRVMQANDGEILRIDHPESLKTFVVGGMGIQPLVAVATALGDIFNKQAGNLELMGGLGPQSKTAHQDEMLNENSSKTVEDMKAQMLGFSSSVIEAICWYLHHDPLATHKSSHSLPGLPQLQMQRQVTPQQRQQIPWEELDIKVDPYSLVAQTPQSRLAALNQVVQQTVMPMQQLMQQQGISFDLNAYLQKVAEYMDMPDLADILTIREPTPAGPGGDGGGDTPGMPASTTRNYVRESRSSSTAAASNRNMVSSLLGADPGGSQQPNPMMMGAK